MKEEKKWYVYRHLFPNGKSYIGITNQEPERRWGKNGSGYRAERQIKMYRAIQKYGWDDVEHLILEDNIKSLDEANNKEKYYISYYNSFFNGYNSTLGGDGTQGRLYSEEERKQLSIKMSGRGNPMYGTKGKKSPNYGKRFSEEHKRKISEAQIGKIISDETRKKQSNHALMRYSIKENHPMYGKKHKQESINNMVKHRRTYKGKNNPNYGKKSTRRKRVVCIDKNKLLLIKEYDCIKDASKDTGVDDSSISKVCSGQQKTAGGYIWRYKE